MDNPIRKADLIELTDSEIRLLELHGYDSHRTKDGMGGGWSDHFRDADEDVYLCLKRLDNEPEPLFVNLRDLRSRPRPVAKWAREGKMRGSRRTSSNF
jgi:hypothetical protein